MMLLSLDFSLALLCTSFPGWSGCYYTTITGTTQVDVDDHVNNNNFAGFASHDYEPNLSRAVF